jgi:superfamily II DNA or RNA helicase
MPFFFKKTKKNNKINSKINSKISNNSKDSKTNSKPNSKKTITFKQKGNIKLSTLSKSVDANANADFKTDSTLSKYIPLQNPKQVKPKLWELPNRKNFFNWVINTFQQYETGNSKKLVEEKPIINEQLALSNVQRLTRDYLQGEGPVRGLLLYIGLGHGKTCAAITISEAILTKKEVVIFSKANLEDNFKKEIRNCGSEYVKTMNYWVFSKCESEKEKALAKELGIPDSAIEENNGVFFVDFTKTKSNYNSLSSEHRTKLDNQIMHIVEKRFTFLHYDDPRKWSKLKENEFDDKIVIVDEVHNIGNTMASLSASAEKYYNLFMNAKNPKYIFLSGTPIINHIFEITKIFNILRGYMYFLEIKFKNTYDVTVDYDKIKYVLKKNKNVDQIIINKAQKTITVTKNPDNFINHPDGKGIIYKPNESVDLETFKGDVTKAIQTMGYKITVREDKATCFEKDREQFDKVFYNADINKLKKIDLIKRRIVGLTSYYEFPDKTKYPEQLPINIIQVPMSEYQFDSYERYRHDEIQKDKLIKKRKDEDNQLQQSTFRLKSRLACSFVFPEETGSPYDSKLLEHKIGLIEKLGDRLSDFEITTEEAEEMEKSDLDKEIKQGYIQLLDKYKDKYLDITNGSLAKYSPKYLAMILNIQKERGKQLVYSYFRNLIGLTMFSYALIQTGKWAPFRIIKKNSTGGKAKKHDTVWELDEREDEKGKHKFFFYTGVEDKEIRSIYVNIYNSTWDKLPQSCNLLIEQIKKIHSNNYYGEVIKMIMTTKTGAEGLDLKEVRYIHISESFWHPVLIDQIIGRGVRNESHLKLVPADRTVEIFIYLATITPNLVRNISHIDVRNDTYKSPNPVLADKAFKVVSSDEYLYLTAERKRAIIGEFQKLMKETAFDCSLNYRDNTQNPKNKGLVCMDYPSKNRDDYLFTPNIEDTIENLSLGQDKIVVEQYGSFPYKDKIYIYNKTPNSEGKMYIYEESAKGRIRLPKAVGEVIITNGKKQFAFFKNKKLDKKKKK